jgi:hypothetical protein
MMDTAGSIMNTSKKACQPMVYLLEIGKDAFLMLFNAFDQGAGGKVPFTQIGDFCQEEL